MKKNKTNPLGFESASNTLGYNQHALPALFQGCLTLLLSKSVFQICSLIKIEMSGLLSREARDVE